ncbi:hypothetical protein AB6A40_000933 [Gnathostoma spinigerum]|uniref:Transmembrane protein n=1 Tax=Gnathostoma spinigerum TaxID=75299 RepID=A0ABD6EA39_9BILA
MSSSSRGTESVQLSEDSEDGTSASESSLEEVVSRRVTEEEPSVVHKKRPSRKIGFKMSPGICFAMIFSLILLALAICGVTYWIIDIMIKRSATK